MAEMAMTKPRNPSQTLNVQESSDGLPIHGMIEEKKQARPKRVVIKNQGEASRMTGVGSNRKTKMTVMAMRVSAMPTKMRIMIDAAEFHSIQKRSRGRPSDGILVVPSGQIASVVTDNPSGFHTPMPSK